MMRQVCCICGTVYGTKPGPDVDTHGHCEPCHARVMSGESYLSIQADLRNEAQQ